MPSYFQWQSPLQWFGMTLGSSIWLAISGAVLLARGHRSPGVVFVVAYALVIAVAWASWARRATLSAYHAWQVCLATIWVVGLVTTAVTHATESYGALNIGVGGLMFLYAGIGIGVPLLMADNYYREKSGGRVGAFSALFDFFAGWA